MPYPTIPDVPHEDQAAGGRVYRLRDSVHVFALHYPGALPHAPDGSLLYVFWRRGRVGEWSWARDAEALADVIATHERVTSRDYEPPDHRAPGGEPAMIRPEIMELMARAMYAARPDAPDEKVIPLRRTTGLHLQVGLDELAEYLPEDEP